MKEGVLSNMFYNLLLKIVSIIYTISLLKILKSRDV